MPARQDALFRLEEVHLAAEQPEQATEVRRRAWEQADGNPSKRKAARDRLHRFIADSREPVIIEDIEPDTEEDPLPGPALPPERPAEISLGRTRLAVLSSILAASIVLIGLGLRAQQPDSVNVEPFSESLPFTTGAEYAPGQLVLRLDLTKWQALSREQQRAHASSLMELASGLGYGSVYIHSADEKLLASVRDGRVFLADPVKGGQP